MFDQLDRRGENLAITKRRAQEDHFQKYESQRDTANYHAHRVNWENNSQSVIERNVVANIARDLGERGKAKLLARRKRLADLYKNDEMGQKSELSALRETSTQRAKRMVVHARKLKAERKAKAQAFAQEMYNRQWRAGCDDLRLIDSESFARHCHSEIAVQREEKIARYKHEKKKEETWAGIWEDERIARVNAEEEQKRRRQRFNRETKNALLTQMEDTRNSKLAEAYNAELEREAIQRQRDVDAGVAAERNRKLLAERADAMHDIVQFNENTRSVKAQVVQKMKEQELNDLNQKLEIEKADDMAKVMEKERMRSDMKDYMAYLQMRKEEEQEMERQVEVLSQEEQDRANRKRDVQWEGEKLARKQLLDDVYAGRAEQLHEKYERQREVENELYVEKMVIKGEVQKAAELELREDAEIRRRDKRNQKDIQRQIQEKHNESKKTTALISEERENAIEGERQYRAFVAREKMSAVRKEQAMALARARN